MNLIMRVFGHYEPLKTPNLIMIVSLIMRCIMRLLVFQCGHHLPCPGRVPTRAISSPRLSAPSGDGGGRRRGRPEGAGGAGGGSGDGGGGGGGGEGLVGVQRGRDRGGSRGSGDHSGRHGGGRSGGCTEPAGSAQMVATSAGERGGSERPASRTSSSPSAVRRTSRPSAAPGMHISRQPRSSRRLRWSRKVYFYTALGHLSGQSP